MTEGRVVDDLESAVLDAQFIAMDGDEAYQALQLAIAAEFAAADWEAWQLVESDDAPA